MATEKFMGGFAPGITGPDVTNPTYVYPKEDLVAVGNGDLSENAASSRGEEGLTSEIQTLTEGGAGLTSFTLTYSSQTTGSIAAAASADTVQAALEALSNLDVGDVTVSGDTGGPYTVYFGASLAETNVSTMTATPTGGTGTVTVAVVQEGGQ